MKKIMMLSLLLTIASCSKSGMKELVNKESAKAEEPISVQLAEINVSSVEKEVDEVKFASLPESIDLDLGELEVDISSSQQILISNALTLPLNLTVNAAEISPFVLKSDTCHSKTLARRGTCKIVVELKNDGSYAEEQVLSKTMMINDMVVNLEGVIKSKNNGVPLAGLTITPANVDFSAVEIGKSKVITVIIANFSEKVVDAAGLVISAPGITAQNSCVGSLARRKSCSIKLTFAATAETPSVPSALLFELMNHQVNYSVEVGNPVAPILAIEPKTLTQSLALVKPAVKTGRIIFTNLSKLALAGPITAESSNPAVSITSFNCPISLEARRTCIVDYSVNSSTLAEGAVNVVLKIKNANQESTNHTLALNITAGGSGPEAPRYDSGVLYSEDGGTAVYQ